MCMIMIRCPHTGTDVATGVDMDWGAFNRLCNVQADLVCSACSGTHTWTKADAWLAHAVRGPHPRGPALPQPPRPVAPAARLRAV